MQCWWLITDEVEYRSIDICILHEYVLHNTSVTLWWHHSQHCTPTHRWRTWLIVTVLHAIFTAYITYGCSVAISKAFHHEIFRSILLMLFASTEYAFHAPPTFRSMCQYILLQCHSDCHFYKWQAFLLHKTLFLQSSHLANLQPTSLSSLLAIIAVHNLISFSINYKNVLHHMCRRRLLTEEGEKRKKVGKKIRKKF